MKPETLAQCLNMIESEFAMKGKENLWTQGNNQWFAAILCNMDDVIGNKAVQHHLLTTREAERMVFLPDKAKILAIYCRLYSPYPTADEGLAEVNEWVDEVGPDGAINPVAPDEWPVFRAYGPPACGWSHRYIEESVKIIGWHEIATGEGNYQEGIAKRWQRVYGEIVQKGQEQIRNAVLDGDFKALAALRHTREPYRLGDAQRIRRAPLARMQARMDAERAEQERLAGGNNDALVPLADVTQGLAIKRFPAGNE